MLEPVEVLSAYDAFVDSIWVIGDSDIGGVPQQAYLGMCIAGEASEISEKLKKAYRDNGGEVDVQLMVKELGDVRFYVTRYAHVLGYTLERVAAANVEKLTDRAARGVLRGKGNER
jgi:NTP pyrophosphatase (non-canonical NTP hydrolase)